MGSRSTRKAGVVALQLSDIADTGDDLTGAGATGVLRDRPTARWHIVDTNLLEHAVERIFSAGIILNSRTGSDSSPTWIDAAITELDEALVALADAAFQEHGVDVNPIEFAAARRTRSLARASSRRHRR